MEEEVRRILWERLEVAPVTEPANSVDAIRALVEPFGGINMPDIDRERLHDRPDFFGPGWDSEP